MFFSRSIFFLLYLIPYFSSFEDVRRLFEKMKRLEKRGGERDEGAVLFDCLRSVGERR